VDVPRFLRDFFCESFMLENEASFAIFLRPLTGLHWVYRNLFLSVKKGSFMLCAFLGELPARSGSLFKFFVRAAVFFFWAGLLFWVAPSARGCSLWSPLPLIFKSCFGLHTPWPSNRATCYMVLHSDPPHVGDTSPNYPPTSF